ncbi:hypothetical protein Ami103574_04280 [Aminipila butyrica]|uniref:Uncharacterized protein n=1 Tax=Aminipila butyrica TaxID=433296 RepID=A0A858BU29_9FIRM|nr:hypothetical protein [Aminipila butyrica]QIB68585.1 hypothetical protein Ami103574_04280 [Aminipila butyrica]
MLGKDEVREVTVKINPSGTGISVLINGNFVDRNYLDVQKIGFEFQVGREGGIEVSCTRTNIEDVYSERKMAAAALAGAKATNASRDEFCNSIDNI